MSTLIPVTGAGFKPIILLANLTASSAQFQALTGSADAAAALEHCYYLETNDRPAEEDEDQDESIPPQMANPRPRVIISNPQERHRNVGTGSWKASGSLAWSLEAEVPPDFGGTPYDERDEASWFGNQWGAIISELKANKFADAANYLNVVEIELIDVGRVYLHEDPFWGVSYRMSYIG